MTALQQQIHIKVKTIKISLFGKTKIAQRKDHEIFSFMQMKTHTKCAKQRGLRSTHTNATSREREMKVKESSNFDQIVLQAALQHYPPRARPDTPPTQPVELANSARHMWQLFRQMRSYRFNMLGVVKAWKLWVQFSRAHAIHKQRANARAKAKRDELLQQAQQAAEHKNMHELWTVVKRLAPKCRFKKVQLHKHGVIMAPEAELDWIAQAFGERFGVHLAKEPPPLQRQHAPVQLAEQEVAAALHHIPVRKAVPPGTLPAALWRACADQIAAPLTVAVNQAWQAPQVNVHQPWANADVALLPKGKKQVKTPLDLRPIGLQHPIGKTLMKVLTSKAKEHITCLVKQWPQTAFVPGRSTATALKVVFSHCYGIRQACAQARLNLHQKHEGQASQHKAPPLRGGLQVSFRPYGRIRPGELEPSLHRTVLSRGGPVHTRNSSSMAATSGVCVSSQRWDPRSTSLLGTTPRLSGLTFSMGCLHCSLESGV